MGGGGAEINIDEQKKYISWPVPREAQAVLHQYIPFRSL